MTATTTASPATGYRGTEKLLWGIVLAVVTFWLFAGTAGTVAPEIMKEVNAGGKSYLDAQSLNLAVSVTALFSGLFIVLMGGLADKIGRVKISLAGIVLGIVGSLLLVVATGPAALPLILLGRAIQGFSAACIMPSTMALVKTYWDGAARQRAVSMWSIGSWGGSGLAALFGGAMVKFTPFGWRAIFMASIAISIVAFLMILGTPESKVEQTDRKAFDVIGLLLFMVGTLSLMIVLLYGAKLGWTSIVVLALAVLGVAAWVCFVLWEQRQARPFIDFALFANTTFTGATISNFLLNATIGMLIVSQQLIQLAGCRVARDAAGACPAGQGYGAWDAGVLTLGYGLVIIAFIRVGEKLLQKFGPRKPMIWGSLIVIASCVLLMMTHLLIGQYVLLAVIAYGLFGLGLAFYATPSTDAALSNLPAAQAGSGAGIYKMASSLGGAIGAAISLAVFTGLASAPATVIGDVVHMEGAQSNATLRLAGMVSLGVNLVFLLLAILSIVMTVPKGGGSRTAGAVAPSPAPAPQLNPDDEKQAVLARLADLPLDELLRLEKQRLVNDLAGLDTTTLRALVDQRRR